MRNISVTIATIFFFAIICLGFTTPTQAQENELDQFSWAGPYIGGSLGYAKHKADWKENDDDWWVGTEKADSSGIYGGGYAGYNLQSGMFVYGIEADIGVASNSTEDNLSDYYDDVVQNDLNWISTIRARVGIAKGNYLFTLTGGYGVADFDTNLTSVDYPGDAYNAKGTRNGWVAGGGVEYRWSDNLSIRFDALYHDFGKKTYTQSGDTDTVEISNTVLTGRVGITYYFNQK